jgi:transposase InsO family protein
MAYGRAAAALFPIGPQNQRLVTLIQEVAARLQDTEPPSVHSVYRWMRRYVHAQHDTAVFMQDAAVVRTRTPRIEPRIKSLLRDHIEALLGSYTYATLHGVTDLALALTARDAAHLSFVSITGATLLVDEFIPVAQHQLQYPARPRRAAAKSDPDSTAKSAQAVCSTLILSPLTVSRETVRKIALSVDRYKIMRARFGRQVADTKRGPRGAGVVTTRPLERVEADHFLCDVHLICGRTGKRLGRPWLTVLVDHNTGLVLGYYISFAAPSAASVLAALRHAILPKDDAEGTGASAGAGAYVWIAFGIPELLVVDNGLDLTSYGVRDACAALGIDLLFTPPRNPWFKGRVERFGRTINTRFIHWLPGTTLGKATADLNYNGAKNAVLTFESFKALFEQYVRTIHNRKPRQQSGSSPQTKFIQGIQQWPPRVPSSGDEFDQAAALHRIRTLQQTGLHTVGLQYKNDALEQIWQRNPASTRLTFRLNPMDLSSILVEHPLTSQYFKVECVTPISMPRTLAYHMAVRGQAKKSGLNPDEPGAIAHSELALKRAIQEKVADSKAMVKRMTAELYRQAELIDTTPEENLPSKNQAVDHQSVSSALDQAFGDWTD